VAAAELHLRPATALGEEELARALERAYEDYVVPFAMDVDRLRRHVDANDVDLDSSLVLVDAAGDVAAVALLAVRGERGWIGGFGVTTPFRGRGLGHRLGALVEDAARQIGLRELQLEVFVQNDRARRVYDAQGFEAVREVLILTRPPSGPPTPASLPVPATDPSVVLSTTRPDPDPVWQREAAGVARVDGVQALVTPDASAPRGAMLLLDGAAGALVLDVWGDAEAARALTTELARSRPDAAATLLNEPDGSPALPGLLAAGWREAGRQVEMRKRLG